MLDKLYGLITRARNSLYDTGVFKSFALGVPTVSVGNITVGGTGKTPLVAFIAEILSEKGEKVCILSRGYGRENPKKRVLVSDAAQIFADAKTSGDEPFELARELLGKAVIVADANRVAAGNWAREKFGITTFVLDDAFQHFRVRRDANIVTVDATNPFGSGKLLPAGILREPLKNLKRADAIVITRANLVGNISDLTSLIKEFNSICPIFVTRNRISQVTDLEYFFQSKNELSDRARNFVEKLKLEQTPILAFCALGNPNNFFEQLKKANFNLIAGEKFPDHHFYIEKDAAKLTAKAKNANAEVLLTTMKDAVKLKNLKFDLPCFVVENKMMFDEAENFRSWLISKINAAR